MKSTALATRKDCIAKSILLVRGEKMNKCYQCEEWKYDTVIERKYGEGTGYCKQVCDAVGCDRQACLLFKQRITEPDAN